MRPDRTQSVLKNEKALRRFRRGARLSLGLEQAAGGLVVVGDDQIASERSGALELGDRISSARITGQMPY